MYHPGPRPLVQDYTYYTYIYILYIYIYICIYINIYIYIYDPYTKLHVNGKLTVNATVNTVQVAPPSVGASGGIGDRNICWNGTSSSHPFSLGIDNSTLWYSVPSGCLHKFYVGGVQKVHINNNGLGIGIDSTLYTLYVSGGCNYSNDLTKRYVRDTGTNGISSTTGNILVIANFNLYFSYCQF